MDVKNIGKRDGDEVVQIYIKNPNDPEGPIKALKGFKRASVKEGASEKVSIELDQKAFYSFSDATQTLEVKPGSYKILYGGSSADSALQGIDLKIE